MAVRRMRGAVQEHAHIDVARNKTQRRAWLGCTQAGVRLARTRERKRNNLNEYRVCVDKPNPREMD